jgi:exportin-1
VATSADELALLPPAQFKLVMDSVVWAFKHTMRDIADTGLNSESCAGGAKTVC